MGGGGGIAVQLDLTIYRVVQWHLKIYRVVELVLKIYRVVSSIGLLVACYLFTSSSTNFDILICPFHPKV